MYIYTVEIHMYNLITIFKINIMYYDGSTWSGERAASTTFTTQERFTPVDVLYHKMRGAELFVLV